MTTGEHAGPYLIEAAIGEGGMGAVYRARDTRLDRTVALKVSKAAFTERFEREARAVAALNHPNICILHAVGPNYLVMELLDGGSLLYYEVAPGTNRDLWVLPVTPEGKPRPGAAPRPYLRTRFDERFG